MTEFQELVKDAPKFVSMERGELVAYAYAMYAAGAKTDAENNKLRKLAYDAHSCIERLCSKYGCDGCPLLHNEMEPCDFASVLAEMRELGIEVD